MAGGRAAGSFIGRLRRLLPAARRRDARRLLLRSASTEKPKTSAPHYPASLLLDGRVCLLIGAGREADERAADLAACGARVVRAEPPVDPALLAGAFLIIVERGAPAGSTRALAAAARAARALVYVVDDPDASDLALPAVARRGRLSVAVSTSGASPVLAQRLRDELDRVLPARLAALTERAAALRERLRGAPHDERAERMRRALAALRLEGELHLPDDEDL